MKNGPVKTEIKVEKISTDSGFTALEERWNRLLASSPADTYFLRWEWLREWWNAYGSGDKGLCILLAKRGDRLIGIAPFYTLTFDKEFLSRRRIMFLGTTEDSLVSEYLDFICAPDDTGTVVRASIEYIAGERLCDDMVLQMMDSVSSSVDELRKAAGPAGMLYRVRNRSSSPYLTLAGDFDEFLSSSGRSLRQNIKSGRRKLDRFDSVEIRKTTDARELAADLDEFVRLHQMRWRSKNMPGAFADRRFLDFQKAVMKKALDDGYLELLFLRVNGRDIAALYNIRYGEKIYFYQSGIDASFSKTISPGLILHSYSIERAIEGGLKEYDFMLQGETDAYKDRWTNEQRCLCDIYMTPKSIHKFITYAKETIKEYRYKERE